MKGNQSDSEGELQTDAEDDRTQLQPAVPTKKKETKKAAPDQSVEMEEEKDNDEGHDNVGEKPRTSVTPSNVDLKHLRIRVRNMLKTWGKQGLYDKNKKFAAQVTDDMQRLIKKTAVHYHVSVGDAYEKITTFAETL